MPPRSLEQRVTDFLIGLSLAVWAMVLALVIMAIAGVPLGHPDFALLFAATLACCGVGAWVFGRVAFDLSESEVSPQLKAELDAHRRTFTAQPPVIAQDTLDHFEQSSAAA